MKRVQRALTAAVGVAVLSVAASACGSVNPDAAVVNGKAIKVRDIEADVAAVRDLRVQPGQEAPNTLDAASLRQILTFEIAAQLLRADLATKNVTVDAAARTQAEASFTAEQAFGARWGSAPASVRARLVDAQATIDVATTQAGGADALNALIGTLLTEARIRVNPRYGTWDPNGQQPIAVNAPLLTER